MRLPELLAPAGDPARLNACLRFGADAVYGGMKSFGLRASAGNFSDDELEKALKLVHAQGKKFYVTLNIFPYDDEMEAFVAAAQRAYDMGVDAAIVSDPGTVLTLRERVPGLPLHISTQANTLNTRAARFWADAGCERIVLARELSLSRVRAMRDSLPDSIALEAFVHGAMCMAYSGRCLLSAAMNGRSANRGACSQPCRNPYTLEKDGERYPIWEDERGTYILSSPDLCMISHLPDLVSAGISSLKIEGRMKTEYYVATVTGAYRRALDCLAESREKYEAALPSLLAELEKASHRTFCTGFYYGQPTPPAGARGTTQAMEYAARCEESLPSGAVFSIRSKLTEGDYAELLTPGGFTPCTLSGMARADTGEAISVAPVPGMRVFLPLAAAPGDMLRVPDRNHQTF